MADQRSGDPSVTGAPVGDASAQSADETGSSGTVPASRASSQDLSERINAAYAASPPIIPEEGPKQQTGAQRFAAALSAAAGKRPESAPSPAVAAPAAAARPTSGASNTRRVRKARLRLTHVDPWSVMKTSFLLSIALGIVTVVAVAVIWSVLSAAGVWGAINDAVGPFVETETSEQFRIQDYLGMSRVMGFTMIVAVVDVVLVTVIATLGAFLYNLAAVLLGGLELTLAEDER